MICCTNYEIQIRETAVPANEEVADGRKRKYPFRYPFSFPPYKDFIFNSQKNDGNYPFSYTFILNAGKEKQKMVRLSIFLLQGLINNCDMLRNPQMTKGVLGADISNTFASFPVGSWYAQ